MIVHVARVSIFTVDQNGNRLSKSDDSTTINQMLNTSMAFLVLPDSGIPSTANYPTIKAYLEAEAALGFKLYHLDQSFIITYDS